MSKPTDPATGPAETEITRLEFDIEWPPKHAAAYLLETPAPILVDAGDPSDRAEETIREGLAERGYEPGDVEAVVVTHPHSDHIGQVPLLREAGATVYAPEPVLERLERNPDDLADGVREVGRSAGYRGEAIEREVERARSSLQRNRRLLAPDEAVGFAFDDSFSVADLEFDPIHTPGHQIDHASLATTVGDQRVLFSGDALVEPFRPGAIHVGIDHGAYEAVDAFHDAMDRLESRSYDRIFPGHGPVFTTYQETIEFTRNELESLTGATLEAVVTVGPATPMEITRNRAGEVRYPAQLLDTLGALGTLERRGRVSFDSSDGVRRYSFMKAAP
ncbi:MBL fold metallo-hydrolase [Natronorubrum texcoconense]|uniref:Glyoxylase, beta-lactamase superfamily II n=1 Tax=Natronorubrum texcoconense TaxID=1095776 RepID=A0A1G8VBI5_9EURY|nr:MBL fold metallo-hydrolase [Natronorubrum texcoconense]SDJ63476.1 Glyoxylase, beta-lactamase superfamily II [Natronorubrum texcoconense]